MSDTTALTQTFKTLLENLGVVRLNMITTSTGASAMQDGDKRQLAAMLSDAMKTIWEMPAGKGWMWPWCVLTSAALTLSSGKIALSTLDYPRWVSLWSADPRGASSSGRFVPCYVDGDGIHPQDDTLGSYFAFYIPRCPEFTHTVVAVATAYATDAIVYDDRATVGSGQCYRCVSGYTTPATDGNLTTDLADTSKWKVQTVHKNFRQACALLAHAAWLEARDKPEEAEKKRQDGFGELERQWKAIRRQQADFLPAHLMNGTWL